MGDIQIYVCRLGGVIGVVFKGRLQHYTNDIFIIISSHQLSFTTPIVTLLFRMRKYLKSLVNCLTF